MTDSIPQILKKSITKKTVEFLVINNTQNIIICYNKIVIINTRGYID